jgi:O-antigen ligase
VARTAVAAVPLVLVPALGAVQGGFHPDTWVWSGALASWAAALALAVGAGAAFLRREWPWVAAAVALLLWTLLSALWSTEPSQSLLEARRTVVYAAVVLALVVLARRGSARILVAATQIAVSGLVFYALARYLTVGRADDRFEGYHLAQPLGYANAVGILAALGILLALAPLADVTSTGVRAASAATVPPLVLALQLTGSNASWLALAVGVLVVGSLQPTPSSLLRPALAVAPLAAAAGLVGHVSRLDNVVATPRLSASVVGLLTLACAAVSGAAVAMIPRPDTGRRIGRRETTAVAAAILLLAGGAFGVARAGSTEPRSSYYRVAWREYRAHPVLGSGAGTYGGYWLRLGSPDRWGGALDAHSLYLETLAELGPVGLLLVAAFLLAPLRHALARRSVPGLPAATGAAVAFLVHAGLDWDWELPAVVVAALACTAAVAIGEPPEHASERPVAAPRWGRRVALAAALVLGAAAIAGARSTTEPSAEGHGSEAAPGAASLEGLRRTTTS